MALSRLFLTATLSPFLSVAVLVLFGLLLWPVARVEELFAPTRVVKSGLMVVEREAPLSGVERLEGSWHYFSGVLADAAAVARGDQGLPQPELVPVPWPLKRDGLGGYRGDRTVGTYHLRIQGLAPGFTYGLFFKEIASAYRLSIDGDVVTSRGSLGDSSPYQAQVGSRVALFQPRGEFTDVVLQVVDQTTSLGGIWEEVFWGPGEAILALQDAAGQRDAFFLASLVMMALFQWILSVVIRRDRAPFFLAVFCTAIVLKSAFSEMMLGFFWFPNLSYESGMQLAYFGLLLLIPAFLAYTRLCFPEDSWRRAELVFLVPTALELGFVLFTPFEWYQAHFVWYQAVIVAGCLTVIVTGVRAMKARRQGAGLFLAGFSLVFLAGINDILFSNQIVQTGYWLNMGLYAFLLIQGVIIARRYLRALVAVEDLSRDLERKVDDRTRELAQERNLYERQAREDSLTGLHNKRALNEVLETEFEAFRRYGHRFSVLMIDLDWFKRVNDTYGHLRGDQLLVDLAGQVKASLRKTDFCARFGGEEFLVVMRHTRLDEARLAAEHLRQRIEETQKLTVSIGVAEVSDETPDAVAVIQRADQALYRAKEAGRNRVEVS